MTLGRSAWVGSQQYGAAVWSADIPSTFDSLRRQVTGGLNICLSGIPYWTTDIGGFHGGDIDDPGFRELITRWFQYGVFCPVMRVHGVRRQSSRPKTGDDIGKADPNHPNVSNEVWSYGEETCAILSDQIRLRDRLRPYIMEQMKAARETGLGPMRPMFMDLETPMIPIVEGRRRPPISRSGRSGRSCLSLENRQTPSSGTSLPRLTTKGLTSASSITKGD